MFGIVCSYLSSSSVFRRSYTYTMSRSTLAMIASTTVVSLFFLPLLVNEKRYPAGLYGEEFEENFAVSTLGNFSNLTHAIGDDTGAELVEPPEDDVTITLEPPQP